MKEHMQVPEGVRIHVSGAWSGTSVTPVILRCCLLDPARGPPLPCFSISASLPHSTPLSNLSSKPIKSQGANRDGRNCA